MVLNMMKQIIVIRLKLLKNKTMNLNCFGIKEENLDYVKDEEIKRNWR